MEGIKAIPFRTPACDRHLPDNESDECPWCEIEHMQKVIDRTALLRLDLESENRELRAEVSRLQQYDLPPGHRFTSYRGECGHEWLKSQSDDCPYCELARVGKRPKAVAASDPDPEDTLRNMSRDPGISPWYRRQCMNAAHIINHLDYELSLADSRLKTILDWCEGNIESQSQIAPFCVQVRDLVERATDSGSPEPCQHKYGDSDGYYMDHCVYCGQSNPDDGREGK